MNSKLHLTVVASLAALTAPAHASTIAYWAFEDGPAGSTPATVLNSANPGFLDGATSASGTRQLNANVVAPAIWDPVTSSYTNNSNTTSILFGGGGKVFIPFDAALEPGQFSIEFFMFAGAQGGFPGIVEKPKVGGGTATGPGVTTWGLGKNNSEFAFMRIDGPTAFNLTNSAGPSTADGQWHHFALTYDGAAARLYRDYTLLATRTTALDYDGLTGLVFGGGASGGSFQNYAGLVDEIRFSHVALLPSQFLQAVPEPSRPLALAAAALLLIPRRGRI